MPYRDAEDRRTYDRERKRRLRAVATGGPAILGPDRLRVVGDVEALLMEAVGHVRGDRRAKSIEKARALAYIGSIALRLIDAHDLQERVEALERVLGPRKAG